MLRYRGYGFGETELVCRSLLREGFGATGSCIGGAID